jgi:hypothetical protein
MKLRQLLEELTLELNMPKPEDAYKFDSIDKTDLGYGMYYKYVYTNRQGDKMEITTSVQPPTVSPITGKKTSPGKTMYVAFGKYDKDDEPEDPDEEERKYKTMTGAGDLIKVMATVVEAIRQTAEKEGGMDTIYKMAWAPADKRRKNIYDLYVKTLFPSFEKDLSASSTSFQQYINKDFKGKEVNEIGLEKEKMEPYGYTTVEDDEDRRVYSFKTDSGLDYMVELEEEVDDDLGMVLYINFGVVDKNDIAAGSNQNVVTNKGEQYRVMNTLSAIIKEDLAINSYIKYITFNPAKRKLPNPISGKERDIDSNSRAKLYMKYIIGRLPNAKEVEDPKYPILIKIK